MLCLDLLVRFAGGGRVGDLVLVQGGGGHRVDGVARQNVRSRVGYLAFVAFSVLCNAIRSQEEVWKEARRRRPTENDRDKVLTVASLSRMMTRHRSLVLIDLVVVLVRWRRSVAGFTAVPPIRLAVRHGARLMKCAHPGRQSPFHATELEYHLGSARNSPETFL